MYTYYTDSRITTTHTVHTLFLLCVFVRLLLSCGCLSADSAPSLLWLVAVGTRSARPGLTPWTFRRRSALPAITYRVNTSPLRPPRYCPWTCPPAVLRGGRQTHDTDTTHYTHIHIKGFTFVLGLTRETHDTDTTHYTLYTHTHKRFYFCVFARLGRCNCLSADSVRTLPRPACRSRHTQRLVLVWLTLTRNRRHTRHGGHTTLHTTPKMLIVCVFVHVSCSYFSADSAPSLLRLVAIGTRGTRTRCTVHYTLRRGAAGLCEG